jgi:hypothetical protein
MKIYSEFCIDGKVIKIDLTRAKKLKRDLEKFINKKEHIDFNYGKIDMPTIWG